MQDIERDMRGSIPRFVHLLYVPTQECNLRCGYCYLEHDSGPATRSFANPSETLDAIVTKLREANVVPFTLSLHGGEVTCLPREDFASLVSYIDAYYRENGRIITEAGFKAGRPHIKTNLYAIDRHIEAIERYNVSMSGSLDLPFSLHEQFRRTAGNQPTLQRILDNLKLLEGLPNRKKASATIFHEHFERIDEIVEDVRYLHEHTCLDMNDFNFMIGFADERCPLTPLTHEEQVAFYRRMHEEFDGTDLNDGVNGAWFAEFTPAYCTGCDNCGDKFMLADASGDVWSCVRGQGHEEFHYGNLLEDSVEDVLQTARTKIFAAHNAAPIPEECVACPYLYLCKTGCPFVKRLYKSGGSYTCKLQQAIYHDHPRLYPPSRNPRSDAYRYAAAMRPAQTASLLTIERPALTDRMPSLREIVAQDPALEGVFDDEAFRLVADGASFAMKSQVLRPERTIIALSKNSDVALYIRKDIMEAACRWPVNNALYLMLLSGNTVTYGDEGRTKQRHVATHQVFFDTLASRPSDDPDCYRFELGPLLAAYWDEFSRERPNNLFATTSALRDRHYAKHRDNAYYHIQTINLPFQNIEFTCDDDKDDPGEEIDACPAYGARPQV